MSNNKYCLQDYCIILLLSVRPTMSYEITNQQLYVVDMEFKFFAVVIQRWYSDTAPQQSRSYK
jgi:hypothetical protein